MAELDNRLDKIIEAIREVDGVSAGILTGETDAENRELLTVAITEMCERYRCRFSSVVFGDLTALLLDLEMSVISDRKPTE